MIFWVFKVWTVWNAYAMADFPAWPGWPHGQTYHTQKPSWRWRNISLFTFLTGRTKELVLDKGIRQKSHKKSGLDCCLQCLLSGVSQAWPAGLRVRVRISRIMPQNVYTRPSVLQLGKVLRVYTSTDTKWLRMNWPNELTKAMNEIYDEVMLCWVSCYPDTRPKMSLHGSIFQFQLNDFLKFQLNIWSHTKWWKSLIVCYQNEDNLDEGFRRNICRQPFTDLPGFRLNLVFILVILYIQEYLSVYGVSEDFQFRVSGSLNTPKTHSPMMKADKLLVKTWHFVCHWF